MSRRLIDLTDRKFSRLTVLSRAGSNQQGKPTWLCRCDCGTETVVLGLNLRSGHTTSCGCYRQERTAETKTKHGLYQHPLYDIWFQMNNRCANPKHRHFKDYGGRDITICPSWSWDDPAGLQNYIAYIEVTLGPKPSPSHSIDRLDNDGNYYPGNLRWASKAEQANNRRPRKKSVKVLL